MSNPDSIRGSSHADDDNNEFQLSQVSYSGLSVCDNMSCSYPFGPACQTCKFKLSVKCDEIDHDQQGEQGERLERWIEEVHLRTKPIDLKGYTFEVGADEKVKIAAERATRLSSPSKVIGKSKVANSFSAQVPVSPHCGSNPFRAKAAHKRVPPLLSPWLDAIFDSTLESHKTNKVFVGGATETRAVLNPCPYCAQPQDDLRLQHLLRCKFAHEEQEREERMLGYY